MSEGPIDLKQLKKLIRLLEESSLYELEVPDASGHRIRLRKGPKQVAQTAVATPSPTQHIVSSAPSTPVTPSPEPEASTSSPKNTLNAPMIGTVYHTPSPDAEPFVKPGDRVEVGQTLCLIEAMKMFNKIKAEKAGVIQEILVEHGQAVEYDQALFAIETSS